MPTNKGDLAVILERKSERSLGKVPDDLSQPSYRQEEPLSEARNISLPSRRWHWMDTRPRTRMRAGGSRLHYQPFDQTDLYGELSDVFLSNALVETSENMGPAIPMEVTTVL